MIFNSVTFLLFLALVVTVYWRLPRRPRLALLLVSSLTFYGFWRIEFLPVILASVLTDYWAAIGIANSTRQSVRRAWLALSLTVNLGLLFYFKYLIFFTENSIAVLRIFWPDMEMPTLNIVLPLGISFYTFQTISYTVDVYRGFISAERDWVIFGCYVTFFPQLVAGPVLRASEVIPQLDKRPDFDVEHVSIGLRRILYGLFLKVVLADNVAVLVDAGFDQPTSTMSAIDVLTLAFLFGFQIYFDFSAYSHIALGSALLMGLRFPENFNFPYLATSPRDFWRRWHISLSSWIRDYLYLPLAGVAVHDRSTGGLAMAVKSGHDEKQNRALFMTWAIMGLWHGANWTFVFWGLYHAVFIFAYRLSRPITRRLPRNVAVIGGWATTLVVAQLSWILFRAPDLKTALAMYGKLLDWRGYFGLGLRENAYLVAALLLVLMVATYFLQRLMTSLRVLAGRSRVYRVAWILGESVFLSAVMMPVFVFVRPIKQFIYFQF